MDFAMRFLSAVSLLALISAAPLAAQETEHDHHQDDIGETVVTAQLGRVQADLLSGTSILAGDELARNMRSSIGETLTSQAGVSATSFGPSASRPVLRGLQGERVRVLTDGVGSFDVSNTSVDHAVAINPLTADRIEVLRGPTALLFGSSAIGGVVNVIDSRIPRTVPDGPVHVDLDLSHASAAREGHGGLRVDVPLGGEFVAHFDGTYSKSKDVRIGGFVLTPDLRAEALASGNADIADLASLKGRLPNTAARTREGAAGLAYIGGKVSLGASVSRLESRYGVPIRFALDPAAPEAEAVQLDMRQTRYDLRGEYAPEAGFLDAIRLRAGLADYRHDELEEDGAIGTSFFSTGKEARLDFVQREKNGWTGISGAQIFSRTINIVGAEKFLPHARTTQAGLFTLQSVDLGRVRFEGGARVESARLKADADAQLGTIAMRRSYTAVSGSLGGNVEFAGGWRLGLNAAHSERAPAAEELFANGPHAGTQAYEIGNTALRKERSNGVELTVHGDGAGHHFGGSLYYNAFSGFIFEAPQGTTIDDLPVFAYEQAKARQWGFEIDASATVAKLGAFDVKADGVIDYTRVTIRRAGVSSAAPRIPALRLLGGLELASDRLDLRAEVERVTGQERVAAFETATPGYTMVNASVTFRPMGKGGPVSLMLSADNLFDVNARRHASVLKDYAPLAGRDVRLTLRLQY
ncbi:MAG: TonB-dependent receptor [Sphingomonadales bacterium]|nr:TonB-dependent receptor [Sphingomonadales bacterium]